jgi:C4-dicarboxylate-specific signal transduction histidine kinase
MMMLSVEYDEFRMVWFFLTAFAAYMLRGKKYGEFITSIIFILVLFFYFMVGINISGYGLFTFFSALLSFNIFAYYFMDKIENETAYFEQEVQYEVEKRQAQEQILLRQYRMANMGEMIDAIAHQWRQPLMQGNMILLNIDDSLENEFYNKKYLQEKISELSSLNRHMSQTIDDFRALLHHEKSKSRFNVAKMIDEVLELMKTQLKEIETSVSPNDAPYSIVGYKNEVIQVVIILISNAIEALKHTEYKKISITIQQKEESIDILIEDNAGGIDNSILDKIFDSYFTTKKEIKGTGLGLYIAKIIIEENMQGKLSVKQGREGAQFTISIKKSE